MGKRNVKNIMAVYNMATDEEIAEGMRWYEMANQLAQGFDSDDTGAGVIAALSPNLGWDQNVIGALRMRDGEPAGIGLPANQRKAERILEGELPCLVLGGKKVRAFFECIISWETTGAVCIDRHAVAIWDGRPKDDHEKKLGRVGFYERVANDYVMVARELGIMPHQVQAVTWVTWRRMQLEA